MSSWTDTQYNYRAAGVSLLDYCEKVRVIIEAMPARRGTNFQIPGLEGEYSFPNKLHEPMNVAVECTLKYTDDVGAITHPDGAPGHVYENLAEIKRLFSGGGGLAQLQRNLPHQGETILDFEVLSEPVLGQNHFQYVFLCHAPKVFWRNATLNSYTSGTGTINLGGNAPVHDAILTFTGDGSIETDDGLSGVEIVGSSGTVVVDCGTRAVTQGGNPAPGLVRPLTNRFLYLPAHPTNPLNPVGVTITGTVEVEWYTKWK